jgi:hypothetical protein
MACSISREVGHVDKDFHLQSKAATAMKARYLLPDSTTGVPSRRDYFGDQGECSPRQHVGQPQLKLTIDYTSGCK